MIVNCRKDTNFYNPESMHPKNQLKPDILLERHEIHPFPKFRDQIHDPTNEQKS